VKELTPCAQGVNLHPAFANATTRSGRSMSHAFRKSPDERFAKPARISASKPPLYECPISPRSLAQSLEEIVSNLVQARQGR
jgi:hypothetical protein